MNLVKDGAQNYYYGLDLISNNSQYYVHNAHGDVVHLTNSSGESVKHYTYDAFGVERNIDTNDTNPFRYCGEYYDAESDSIYLRARYYTPNTGRFTQEDTHWNLDNMIYGDKGSNVNCTEKEFLSGVSNPNEKSIDIYGEKFPSFLVSRTPTKILSVLYYPRNLTPDIVAITQTGNIYVYCINNPIVYIDSSGLFSWGNVGKTTVNNAVAGAVGGATTGAITGGTVTVFVFTLPAAAGGAIIGGIGGAVTGFVGGVLDEIW